ncbi:hypothetical protein [Methanoculleus sp.]|uniref:hypothetical protein n=1 Tax=Methanoculleus sp. TaxID=90427 RepID=UPI002FCAA5A7
MPSVRINDGDLPSGAGVEGGRKRRPDETPAPAREKPETTVEKDEQGSGKPRRARPRIGKDDRDADIFYTGTK